MVSGMLTCADLHRQIQASAETVLEEIATASANIRFQFFAALLRDLGARDPRLVDPANAYRAWRSATSDAEAAERLRVEGCFDFLVRMWSALGERHYSGKEMLVFADWLIASSATAEAIAQLPYAIGNWNGTWRQVARSPARACEKIAAATLARDPENEPALYLFAQDDFLAAIKRKRAPTAPRPIEADVAKIALVVRLFEEDRVHPLQIPSLDPIKVESSEIVRALIHHLETTTAWRARCRLIAALGRARVDLDDVTAALEREITRGDRLDDVAMAAHYGLKNRGTALLAPFVDVCERMIAAMTEAEQSYGHLWPLRAVITLTKFAAGPEHARGAAFLAKLRAELPSMPAWKRERIHHEL